MEGLELARARVDWPGWENAAVGEEERQEVIITAESSNVNSKENG